MSRTYRLRKERVHNVGNFVDGYTSKLTEQQHAEILSFVSHGGYYNVRCVAYENARGIGYKRCDSCLYRVGLSTPQDLLNKIHRETYISVLNMYWHPWVQYRPTRFRWNTRAKRARRLRRKVRMSCNEWIKGDHDIEFPKKLR